MTKYTYPNSACLDTPNYELIVGEKYDYKEGSIIGECEFLGDASDEKYNIWKFKWTIHPFEDNNHGEFECSELKAEKYYYSGMVHILPHNSYIFPKRPHNFKP